MVNYRAKYLSGVAALSPATSWPVALVGDRGVIRKWEHSGARFALAFGAVRRKADPSRPRGLAQDRPRRGPDFAVGRVMRRLFSQSFGQREFEKPLARQVRSVDVLPLEFASNIVDAEILR